MSTAITVFGAGSWGTALTSSLASAGRRVVLWARRPEASAEMASTRRNPTYLPDVELPDTVEVTSDLPLAAKHGDLWVVATPSQAVRNLAEQLVDFQQPQKIVVSVAKGIEPVLAIGHGRDLMAGASERLGEEIAHGIIVFREQYASHGLTPLRASSLLIT